jgi:YVTN family beta-propeller protein
LPSENVVAVIDLETGVYDSQMTVGTSPTGVAFSPDGTLAYVTNTGSGTVSVIDAVNNRATSTTITAGESPAVVEFSPNGQVAYVGDYTSGQISIIKTSDNSVTSISVGLETVKDIAFTPDSSKAYIANGYDMAVINTATGTQVDTFGFQDLITGVAVSPDGSTVFFTQSYSKKMTLMNAATGVIGESLDTGVDPHAVAVSPNGALTLVTNGGDNFVSVFLHNPALAPPITTTSGSATSIAAGTLTASLTDASFPEQTFSHDAQYPTTEVILSADDKTGLLSGWNVTLQASDMVWTSPGGSSDADRNINAGNLSVFLVRDLDTVTTLEGDPFSGGSVGSNTTLDTPVSVLFTEPGHGSGSYTVPLTLQLSVPANAATGTYQGTVTTTISAAP